MGSKLLKINEFYVQRYFNKSMSPEKRNVIQIKVLKTSCQRYVKKELKVFLSISVGKTQERYMVRVKIHCPTSVVGHIKSKTSTPLTSPRLPLRYGGFSVNMSHRLGPKFRLSGCETSRIGVRNDNEGVRVISFTPFKSFNDSSFIFSDHYRSKSLSVH